MPVGALLAPLIASAILPEGLGALGVGLADVGIGAGLGAGTGAAFGALTGQGAGPGAVSGAIGGGLTEAGGLIGPELGIGATAGSAIGGATGGALGAATTGGNPLTGAVEGAAGPLLTGAVGGQSGASSSAPGAGASAITGSTGISAPGPSAAGVAGPGTVGGTGVAGGPTDFLLPGTDTAVPGGFSAGSIDTTGGGDFGSQLSKLLSDPKALLGALPLLMGTLQGSGSGSDATEAQLKQLAGQSQSQAAGLMAPIQTGVLPRGAQEAVDAATRANKASIKSNYANLGLSGSTMEAQATGGVDRNAAAQTFEFADKLLTQGMVEQGRSADIYSTLLKSQMTKDQQFQQALMLFARGLAGGGSGASYGAAT